MKWIESHSAPLAWAGIVVVITAYVAIYDIWAYKTAHKMMTTQFRDWLHGEVAGPIIAALWVAIFVGLSFHFLVRASK